MPDTLTPNYTKEELDAAKAELAQMKPEDLLFLKMEKTLAEDAISLPEAPAIAFMELRATSGAKINLTVRAINGQSALDALAVAVAYARERYAMATVGQPISSTPLPMTDQAPPLPIEEEDGLTGLTVSAQTSGTPTTQSMTQTPATYPKSTSDITVESIIRERKRDGKGDFLRVRGGMFTKFGVPCYAENFPQGLDVSKMQYGIEYPQIPEFMRFATVTTDKPNRVIAFHN